MGGVKPHFLSLDSPFPSLPQPLSSPTGCPGHPRPSPLCLLLPKQPRHKWPRPTSQRHALACNWRAPERATVHTRTVAAPFQPPPGHLGPPRRVPRGHLDVRIMLHCRPPPLSPSPALLACGQSAARARQSLAAAGTRHAAFPAPSLLPLGVVHLHELPRLGVAPSRGP